MKKEQKSFLKHLKHKSNIKYQDEIFSVPQWLILSLQSELGEILNASKIHKFWDKQEVDREHLLEECADFLAHLGNLANMLEVDLKSSTDLRTHDTEESIFLHLAYKITTLTYKKQFVRGTLLTHLLPGFLQLVHRFGFEIDELKEAYYKKLEINYVRFK